MTASASCGACGAGLVVGARFCHGCGAQLAAAAPAEYKQVTVLFADVVHSMDIAAAVGPERLREVMTELFECSSSAVVRYGGTIDKFTGDGLMAVFGAPVALEDHAVRACLAAHDIQCEAQRIAANVKRHDPDVSLQVRVGLNSGEVVAGDIGSGPGSYTTIGDQVGLAQRMESVAPPGTVLLSESTARLVGDAVTLGAPEAVHLKGVTEPMTAHRLIAVTGVHGRRARHASTLVGRAWELGTIAAMLDQSRDRRGRIVGLVGPPGIGKSRMVAEIAKLAAARSFEVFTTHCESHTSGIPFHAAAGLLRDIFAIAGLDDDAARANVRARLEEADAEELALLDDLLGIAVGDIPLPAIDPDARGRRLTALLNGAAVARSTPAVFVVEDAHWVDEVSETMIAQFAAVVPQTRSLMLVTYRPEYHGALDKLPGSHRIALAPLDDSESVSLAVQLLGTDQSVAGLVSQVADRAAGNPFFAEELVRDLAERGVLTGTPGAYLCRSDVAAVRVPASLHATIAARIDRLGAVAKRTLNAAAVIGTRFTANLLAFLIDDVDVDELSTAEFVDQVTFSTNGEYEFRHPLIRTVAYESQLKADRAELHRRLAGAIEARDRESVDANAALVAQHLEAAGDLHAAYDWHLRAAGWARFRDVTAARTGWQRARDVADRLPADDPNKTALRIGPRAALCASSFRFSGSIEEAGYDELCELCTSVDDEASLALGMAGMVTLLIFHNRFGEAAHLATESVDRLESIRDQALGLTVLVAAANAKSQAGEAREGLCLAQRAIDLADGQLAFDDSVLSCPLALAIAIRGANRMMLGTPGWRDDVDRAVALAKPFDTTTYVATLLLKYALPISNGISVTDDSAIEVTAEAQALVERCGDDFALDSVRLCRGIVLAASAEDARRRAGLALMAQYRDASIRHGYTTNAVRWVDAENARERARMGDYDTAVALARDGVEFGYRSGDMTALGAAVLVLVEVLISRGGEEDLAEAEVEIARLAGVPTDPGFVLHELPLLRMRALLARVHGDESGYRNQRDRYREAAERLGFEGHIAFAAAME